MSASRGDSKNYNPTPVSTSPPSPLPPESAQSPVRDPSMEDIFADIRRALTEGEGPRAQAQSWPESNATAPYGLPARVEDNVMILDNSMMVTAPASAPRGTISPAPELAPLPSPLRAGRVAPEVASHSINNLVRTMVAERSMLVSGLMLPVENIVGDTVRSLIKEWLDANLPHLVERVVRVEIERLVD